MSYKINVINREGDLSSIQIDEGTTIRDAIEDNLQIDNFGICGGNCSCSTCHIYIDPNDFSKFKSKEKDEIETLESTNATLTEYSRLSCQIDFDASYNDITITIAPE